MSWCLWHSFVQNGGKNNKISGQDTWAQSLDLNSESLAIQLKVQPQNKFGMISFSILQVCVCVWIYTLHTHTHTHTQTYTHIHWHYVTSYFVWCEIMYLIMCEENKLLVCENEVLEKICWYLVTLQYCIKRNTRTCTSRLKNEAGCDGFR
jgi:hypothetical protein